MLFVQIRSNNSFPPGFIPLGLHRKWVDRLELRMVLCKPALGFSRAGVLWLRVEWHANPLSDAANQLHIYENKKYEGNQIMWSYRELVKDLNCLNRNRAALTTAQVYENNLHLYTTLHLTLGFRSRFRVR